MSVRKRNEYLEDSESDAEADDGYDSDAVEESKGVVAGRSSKRRRVERASDEDSPDGIEDEGSDVHREDVITAYDLQDRSKKNTSGAEDVNRGTASPSLEASTPKQVSAAQKAAQRSGVVYISRIPPFMKPQTLKHFLGPHAARGLGRIFLTPEDHEAHSRRVRSGGNKKKSYTDGWVEFLSKREAKIAVDMLNGNIIGGKKGNFYHDDLWSMKYLKGFKWSHLTEQIANENAERAARMREEVRKTRQENKAFVEDVARGKMLASMDAKKRPKGHTPAINSSDLAGRSRHKKFKQKTAQKLEGGEALSQQASRVQSMIF